MRVISKNGYLVRLGYQPSNELPGMYEVYQLRCCHCSQLIEIRIHQTHCNQCNGKLTIEWLEGRKAAA